MAPPTLPRSNFGTASLIERKDMIPPVELDEDKGAEVDVEDTTVIEEPGLNIQLEDDGGVVVDFDPQAMRPDGGDFSANLAEEVDDRELARISSDLLEEYETNKNGRKDWEEAYSSHLASLDLQRGTASPCIYTERRGRIKTVAHGDDFMCLGSAAVLSQLLGKLKGQ